MQLRINLQRNKQDQAVAGSETDLRLASIVGYVSDEFIPYPTAFPYGNIVGVHYTTSCNTQSSAPEDG